MRSISVGACFRIDILSDASFINCISEVYYRWTLSSEPALVPPKDHMTVLIDLGITPLLRSRARTLERFKADAAEWSHSTSPTEHQS